MPIKSFELSSLPSKNFLLLMQAIFQAPLLKDQGFSLLNTHMDDSSSLKDPPTTTEYQLTLVENMYTLFYYPFSNLFSPKLVQQWNQLLKSTSYPILENWEDDSLNGLQLENTQDIKTFFWAVSFSLECLNQISSFFSIHHPNLKEQGCALSVHHGFLWKSAGLQKIEGVFRKRLEVAFHLNLHLFASHLPLDAHPLFGNSMGIIRLCHQHLKGGVKDFSIDFIKTSKSKYPCGLVFSLNLPITYIALYDFLKTHLNPQHIFSNYLQLQNINQHSYLSDKTVCKIGIVTGGAGKLWYLAKRMDCQAFITGEISEYHWRDALENQIGLYGTGHQASEKYGVMQLKDLFEKTFPLIPSVFLESENPV